jgi:hypothetical protein
MDELKTHLGKLSLSQQSTFAKVAEGASAVVEAVKSEASSLTSAIWPKTLSGDTMHALVWHGNKDMRYEIVQRPEAKEVHDALIKVTATTICGSDLHMYNGEIGMMKKGDVIGHEFMGNVIDIGREVKGIKIGQRVVVSFNIACGTCVFCKKEEYTACEITNPKKRVRTCLWSSYCWLVWLQSSDWRLSWWSIRICTSSFC